MRVLAILLLFGMLGCTTRELSHSPKLPRRWEVPTIYVRLPYDMLAYDENVALVKVLCEEFAVRVYDAFDGQAVTLKFVICNPSTISERQPGVINLFQKGSTHRNEAFVGISPDHPGYAYVEMPTSLLTINRAAGTMVHEWLHAYLGLGDEYKKPGESGNNRSIDCPDDINSEHGVKTNACIMDHNESKRELCLPKDHNPGTDQGAESCYEHVARMLFEHHIALITVPTHTIMGPVDPPTPTIKMRLK